MMANSQQHFNSKALQGVHPQSQGRNGPNSSTAEQRSQDGANGEHSGSRKVSRNDNGNVQHLAVTNGKPNSAVLNKRVPSLQASG